MFSVLCDILQFNIIDVIFVIVKESNQFYLLGGSWCQTLVMMTLCPWPLTFSTQNQ